MEHIKSENSDGVEVLDRPKKTAKKLDPPKKYAVIFHNDDYTPKDFVVWALIAFFHKTEEVANSITLEVHKKGTGVAGVYDYQIAEQKIADVAESAKEHNYPLQVTGEQLQ